jgi:predicted nucleotidyltransferase
MKKHSKNINKIVNICEKFEKNSLGIFIIGSYVYDRKEANDIDVVVISSNNLDYKTVLHGKKKLKVSIIPIKYVEADYKKHTYGTFLSGRFLNPLEPLTATKYVTNLQQIVLLNEIGNFIKRNKPLENLEIDTLLEMFIVERSMFFTSYVKNASILRKYKHNKFIKAFMQNVYDIDKFKLKKIKGNLGLGINEVVTYWKTRTTMKGEKNINWAEIFKKRTGVEFNKQLMLKFEEISKRI